MDDLEVSKPVRDADHIQNVGRPLSTAVLNPRAFVRHGMVQRLVGPLELAPKVEVLLVARIAKAMGRYIVSVRTDEHHDGPTVSNKKLDLIARTSKRLARQLAALNYAIQKDLEVHRFEDCDQAKERPFDLQLLVPRLERLSRSALRAKAASAPNRDGPSAHDLLANTVADLMPVLEHAGLTVSDAESSSTVMGSRPRIEGNGGALLISIFALFDPSVDCSAVWSAVDKVRKGSIKPTGPRNGILAPDGPTISQITDEYSQLAVCDSTRPDR